MIALGGRSGTPVHQRGAWRWIVLAGRSVAFNLVFYFHLIAMLVVVAPVSPLLPERACMAAARGWARRSLWLLRIICRTRIVFRGLENLPDGPFLLASKHQSFVETFAFLTVIENPTFIMKRELAYVPLWGWFAWRAGMIFVTRGARAVALGQIVRGTLRMMAKGRPVVIAPEGTRRPPGAPPAYKYGIAFLRREIPGLIIVPVALNSGLFWSRSSPLRYPGTIVISCLPPIKCDADDGQFLRLLAEQIEAECDRLLIEASRLPEPPRFGPEALARLAAIDPAAPQTASRMDAG